MKRSNKDSFSATNVKVNDIFEWLWFADGQDQDIPTFN